MLITTTIINVSKTTPAIISFTLPNSLLYSGEIKSINFSKPRLNISNITTKKQITIIVIKYVFDTSSRIVASIIKKIRMSCILIFLSLDIPLNKPRLAQITLSLKVVFVMPNNFELIVYKNYCDAPAEI